MIEFEKQTASERIKPAEAETKTHMNHVGSDELFQNVPRRHVVVREEEGQPRGQTVHYGVDEVLRRLDKWNRNEIWEHIT